MSLGGGGDTTISNEEPRISNLRIQTSAYGAVIPLVWGRTRITGNLIWYSDFTAIPHTTTTSSGGGGGKGGGSSGSVTQTTTTYTYSAAMILGLCAGEVSYLDVVWKDKEKTTLTALGLTLFSGSSSQSVWGHLTSHHPTQAVSYRGTAYVASAALDLGGNAAIPLLGYEVVGRGAVSGYAYDALPSTVITDIVTDPILGAGLSGSVLASLVDYNNYCIASGFVVSPAYTEQAQAQVHLRQLLDATNSDLVWSEGKIKIVPYGDQALTGAWGSWSPNLTPQYNLTDDHFLLEDGDEDGPVTCTRGAPADAYNQVQVEFFDRNSDYNVAIAEAKDQANIELYGLRSESPQALHLVCRQQMAQDLADVRLRRKLYVRNVYEFRLGWTFCRLEPMDLVTLTDSGLGLNQQLVRILEVEEDEWGTLKFKAEEMLVGTSAPAATALPDSGGYIVDFNSPPGNANTPVIFEPPVSLSGEPQVWLATAGGANWGGCEVWGSLDDSSYERFGVLSGRSRHGVLSTSLPVPSYMATAEAAVSLWAPTGATVVDDILGPDGLTYSKAVTDDSTSTWEELHYSLGTISAGQTITKHVWVKKDSVSDVYCIVRLNLFGGTGINADVRIRTSDGSVVWTGGASGTVSRWDNNWWFVEISATNSNNTGATIIFYPAGGLWGGGYTATQMRTSTVWAGDMRTSTLDLTSTVRVDLSTSLGSLSGCTEQERDLLATLSFVDEELISFQTATLVSGNTYDLSRIRRGAHGTVVATHSISSSFARLDQALFKYPYSLDLLGETVYFKLASFNIHGAATQDLSLLNSSTYTFQGSPLGTVSGLTLEQPFTGLSCKVMWNAYGGSGLYTYKVEVRAGAVLKRTVSNLSSPKFEYSHEDAVADGGPFRDLEFRVYAVSETGQSASYAILSASNPQHPAPSNVTVTAALTTASVVISKSAELDYAGSIVCMSTSSGFTPGPANEIYRGADNYYNKMGLASGTYYFRAAQYDVYGDSGLNWSGEYSVTPLEESGGVEIVATLPATGNFEGRIVYLTTDDKLYRYTGSAWTSAVPAVDITGTITSGQIATGAVGATQIATGAVSAVKLASGLSAVEIVATLPATGNFEGRAAYLTTDDKLYRYTGAAWTSAVPAGDITGTLADAQIAALAASKITGQLSDAQLAAIAAAKVTGQITTTQITDDAITTAKVAAGAITAAEIAANTITASQIAANTITASQIAANTITASQIAANTITASQIAANTITASKIAANTITASQIAANTITAGQIASGTITASQIAANTITAGQIASGTITASQIAANTITASQIAANTITASQLATNSVTSDEITAGAVTAAKISVTALSAISANLGTITAGNMTLDASGFIRGGQTGYDSGSGFWLGYSSGTYKYSLGNSAGNKLLWDGTNLTIVGAISGGSININNKFTVDSSGNVTIKSATTGARVEVYNNVIKVFDASNVLRVKMGDLSA